MNKKRVTIPSLIILLLALVGGYWLNSQPRSGQNQADQQIKTLTSSIEQKPFNFMPQLQLQLSPLDSLGRAVNAHIQLRDALEPTAEREDLNYNPPGYKQQFFYHKNDKGKIYKDPLWSRGHLVGYQFSGLNNEPRNLVPMTMWTNAGAYYQTDEKNEEGMTFYESRLDDWLYDHKTDYLDYQVTPLYQGNELVPRQIRLAYLGYDQSGKKIPIKLGSSKEKQGRGESTVVILDNASPNAKIDYLTGDASNTVRPE